jgi:hypothetical protein
MKYFLFGFFILNLNITYATDWSDLELYEQYSLDQAINIPEILQVSKGEKFEVFDIFAGGSSLIYFQMHLVNCQNPDLVSDIILMNPSPKDLPNNRSVGIQLETGCNFNIWVEGKDFYSNSLFKKLDL